MFCVVINFVWIFLNNDCFYLSPFVKIPLLVNSHESLKLTCCWHECHVIHFYILFWFADEILISLRAFHALMKFLIYNWLTQVCFYISEVVLEACMSILLPNEYIISGSVLSKYTCKFSWSPIFGIFGTHYETAYGEIVLGFQGWSYICVSLFYCSACSMLQI